LTECDFDTPTTTRWTRPDRTLLASPAFAFGANNIPRQSELGCFTLVQIFQGDVDAMYKVLCFPDTLAPRRATEEATATEELTEKILSWWSE
jgi:hypothetical protein